MPSSRRRGESLASLEIAHFPLINRPNTRRSFCNDEPFLLVIAHHLMDSECKTFNCFSQLLKAFEASGNDTVAVRQVAIECISKYGVAACASYSPKAR